MQNNISNVFANSIWYYKTFIKKKWSNYLLYYGHKKQKTKKTSQFQNYWAMMCQADNLYMPIDSNIGYVT
jgi:hypothetical protein